MAPAKVIDWQRIKQEIEATEQALARGRAPAPEAKREILHRRAAALAQRPAVEAPAAAALSVVAFSLAGEKYALELPPVQEVFRLRDLTPVPCTPPFVLGIINMRGQIVSVINLKQLFDLTQEEFTESSRIIILADNHMRLGIVADEVFGGETILLKEMRSQLTTLAGRQAEYLKGVTKDRVALLDAGRILGDEGLIVREEIEI